MEMVSTNAHHFIDAYRSYWSNNKSAIDCHSNGIASKAYVCFEAFVMTHCES